MDTTVLGGSGISVSRLGFGCMGMSEFYGQGAGDAASLKVLEHALEKGVTFFDTADMYGSGHNETLVGQFLKGRRDRVVLATKFGIVRDDGGRRIDTSPAYIRKAVDASLLRLKIDIIDLYYAHRINRDIPIEDTVGTMADLIAAGKVRALGLSEVSAATLKKAHAVHQIAAIQSEYSLWTRDPEADVLKTCREQNTAFVAYSLLGRGFLTGAYQSEADLADDDFRKQNPRFQGDNLKANLALVDKVKAVAADKRATPAQIALAWLLAQGHDVIPIPGTRNIGRLDDNIGSMSVHLDAEDLARLDAIGEAAGTRYPEAAMSSLNV